MDFILKAKLKKEKYLKNIVYFAANQPILFLYMPSNSNHLIFWVKFSCIVLFFAARRDKKTTDNEIANDPVYQSEEFISFYDKFSTDSTFQMDHTVFPLEGMKAQKDSLDIQNPDFKWQKDDWKLHKPYDDMDGTFSREMLDLNGIVIERISDQSGKYSMERRLEVT